MPSFSPQRAQPSAIVKAGSQVLVADVKELIRFSYEDGKEIDRIALPDIAVEAGIAVIDGLVIVSTIDGKVTAFK